MKWLLVIWFLVVLFIFPMIWAEGVAVGAGFGVKCLLLFIVGGTALLIATSVFMLIYSACTCRTVTKKQEYDVGIIIIPKRK